MVGISIQVAIPSKLDSLVLSLVKNEVNSSELARQIWAIEKSGN